MTPAGTQPRIGTLHRKRLFYRKDARVVGHGDLEAVTSRTMRVLADGQGDMSK